MSPILGRRIRQDDLSTLGISTQTLAEDALRQGHWGLAAELVEYFATEIRIMNDVLFVWLADILDDRIARAGPMASGLGGTLLAGFRAFEPGRGDLDRALAAIRERQSNRAQWWKYDRCVPIRCHSARELTSAPIVGNNGFFPGLATSSPSQLSRDPQFSNSISRDP